MIIAIDAMGGDNAPKAVVEGVLDAINEIKNLQVTLVGNETEIRKYLTNDERINIIHTEEIIGGDEEPIRAVRRKKQSSLVLMANEVKEKRADARSEERRVGKECRYGGWEDHNSTQGDQVD